jgi:hypothetical protein
MPHIGIKVAEITARVFSTGYAQVFKLYGVTAPVVNAMICDLVIVRTKLFRLFAHLSLPHPVPLNMMPGALNTRAIG